jgi:putative ABC transport system permease protein
MLAIFAGVAAFIACLGLFGLSVYSAEQRTKEIGIRKTMGATRLDIVKRLLWQFSKPVIWANLIAWPIAGITMSRWLQGFAYHINLEPWLFLSATLLALMIALLTVSGHAILVARAKPATALRYE